jgi:CBS domain containing-hemolysin-like protein
MLDSSSGLSYIFLIVLVALSGFFSGSETALTSVNKIRLKSLAESGNEKAARTLRVAENYERMISTVLIGNNIVNIASASLATVIFTVLLGADKGAAVSTIVMTIVVLIFGEVLPKNYAKNNADSLAMLVSGPISFLMTIFKPFSAALSALSGLMARLTGGEDDKPSVTEEELKYIVESIEEEGVLEENESDLVQSALEFDEIEVQEIVTPRVDMVTLDVEDSWEDILELAKNSKVSRIPVYEGSIDNIIGLVHVRDILEDEITSTEHDIHALLTQCLFVHKTMNLSGLLEKLRKEKMPMAIVTDDYGGTMGLVTIEDIVEELVGEIWDEYDEFEEELVKKDEHTYEVTGDYNIYDLMDELDGDNRSFESDYNTVSGWILEQLEHIPTVGEQMVYEDRMRVTVTEMDDQRITKVTIELLPPKQTADSE